MKIFLEENGKKENEISRTKYRGYIIDINDIGRVYIYNTESPYSEDSDSLVLGDPSKYPLSVVKKFIDKRLSYNTNEKYIKENVETFNNIDSAMQSILDVGYGGNIWVEVNEEEMECTGAILTLDDIAMVLNDDRFKPNSNITDEGWAGYCETYTYVSINPDTDEERVVTLNVYPREYCDYEDEIKEFEKSLNENLSESFSLDSFDDLEEFVASKKAKVKKGSTEDKYWEDEGIVWAIQDYFGQYGSFSEDDIKYLRKLGFTPDEFMDEDYDSYEDYINGKKNF